MTAVVCLTPHCTLNHPRERVSFIKIACGNVRISKHWKFSSVRSNTEATKCNAKLRQCRNHDCRHPCLHWPQPNEKLIKVTLSLHVSGGKRTVWLNKKNTREFKRVYIFTIFQRFYSKYRNWCKVLITRPHYLFMHLNATAADTGTPYVSFSLSRKNKRFFNAMPCAKRECLCFCSISCLCFC